MDRKSDGYFWLVNTKYIIGRVTNRKQKYPEDTDNQQKNLISGLPVTETVLFTRYIQTPYYKNNKTFLTKFTLCKKINHETFSRLKIFEGDLPYCLHNPGLINNIQVEPSWIIDKEWILKCNQEFRSRNGFPRNGWIIP